MQRIPPEQIVTFWDDKGITSSGKVVSSKADEGVRVYTVSAFPDGHLVDVPEDRIKPIAGR
jgi:hypothetical protein